MSNQNRKLRFLVPRGYNGAIIARGATVEITEPWASRFIADGTAEEVKADSADKPKAKGKK